MVQTSVCGVVVVLLTAVRLTLTASVGGAAAAAAATEDVSYERAARNARSVSSRGRTTNEYNWLCPTAMCRPVSSQCRTVEYMVFEYDVLLGNRAVSVRCQTCEYCLDVPFRTRRSLFDGSGRSRHRCNHLSCPTTQAGCSDLRLTDVFVDGHFCRKCPACYDNTVVATGNNS